MMAKFSTENGSTIEIKFDSIHVTTNNKKEIYINAANNPVDKSSRIFLENGDNIGIQSNSIYIDSLTTKIFVNDQLTYYMFPYFLSDSFREFCANAYQLKKEIIADKEIVVGYFELLNVRFKVISPSHPKGNFKFIFQNILPKLTDNIGRNVSVLRKLKFHNFNVDFADEKNILILKTNRFDYNDIFHTLNFLSKIDLNSLDNDNSENFTA